MARHLVTYVHIGGSVYGPDDVVPDEVAELITNPKAWSEPAATSGYASQTKADLEAEVAMRNQGREDDAKVVVGGKGNKPDLIAALEADDAARA